jgi:hypothetical protein
MCIDAGGAGGASGANGASDEVMQVMQGDYKKRYRTIYYTIKKTLV